MGVERTGPGGDIETRLVGGKTKKQNFEGRGNRNKRDGSSLVSTRQRVFRCSFSGKWRNWGREMEVYISFSFSLGGRQKVPKY